MRTRLRGKVTLLFMVFGLLLTIPAVALASDVGGSVVDTTAPTGSVTLAPGNSGNIQINWSVTGKQEGNATFQVFKDWTVSGGTVTGSNPETVSVGPRAAQDPATTGTVDGTVTVASGQAAGGPFPLQVTAFNITNDNQQGAKLAAGTFSTYQVTVQGVSDPCAGVSDPAAPVITANPDSPNGGGGWYKTVPSVSATSATSGATITYATKVLPNGTKSSYSSTPPTLQDGTTEVFAKATSATCGRISESSRVFMVDTVAPSIGDAGSWTQTLPGNARTPDGTDPWYVTQVFNKFTASDATSDLANPMTDAVFTKGSGTQEGDKVKINSGPIYDVAGNSSSLDSTEFKIDLTNPTINHSLSPAAASTGWYNISTGAPTVTFTCNDVDGDNNLANGDASGVFSCPDQPDGYTFGEGADQSHQGTAKDNAGRTATDGVSNVDVDLTAPKLGTIVDGNAASSNVCTASGPPTQPTGFSPSDSLSLIDASKTGETWNVPGASTFPFGDYTYEAHATDNAGNTDSYGPKTYHYDYGIGSGGLAYDGVLQPINMPPATGTFTPSVFKLGSTVPVKFKLACGQTSYGDAVARLFVKKSDSTAAGDVNEAISTSAATTGNLFRYDATGGQYIFNLSTKSGYTDANGNTQTFSAGTWNITIKFLDGTTKTATFDLKK